MSTAHFASMPNISLPRTKMPVQATHATSWQHGKLIPLYCLFVQPGDSYHLDIASLVRMSTPKYPIFGNISMHFHSFFVPMRLLWEHTEEFFGENKTSHGPQTTEYTIPSQYYGNNSNNTAVVGSISHYLGKPLGKRNSGGSVVYIGTSNQAHAIKVSVLKERGYYLIWNECYRAQQLQDPYLVYTDDSGDIASRGGVKKTFDNIVLPVCKKFDYFTSVTTMPQYSANPVELPLGDYAPLGVLVESQTYNPKGWDPDLKVWDVSMGDGIIFGKGSGQQGDAFALYNDHEYGYLGVVAGAMSDQDDFSEYIQGSSENAFHTNLVANLSEATAASVNTLRTAFALQRFLERDNFGTRYPEIIKAHFGVNSSLAILQRPQLLKKASVPINIQQVLATAQTTNSGVETAVGSTGANSVTASRNDIVNNSFDEFGFLYIMMETKFNQLYSQGLDAFDIKQSKYDFYFPEFASIGDQAVKVSQIRYQSTGTTPLTQITDDFEKDVFGYQEAWAEYRYVPDRVSGLLDPQAPSNLAITNLGVDIDRQTVAAGVTEEFIIENREPLYRALVTGSTGPDYIGDFLLTGTMIRTMQLYSIPGLIDHVGGM